MIFCKLKKARTVFSQHRWNIRHSLQKHVKKYYPFHKHWSHQWTRNAQCHLYEMFYLKMGHALHRDIKHSPLCQMYSTLHTTKLLILPALSVMDIFQVILSGRFPTPSNVQGDFQHKHFEPSPTQIRWDDKYFLAVWQNKAIYGYSHAINISVFERKIL